MLEYIGPGAHIMLDWYRCFNCSTIFLQAAGNAVAMMTAGQLVVSTACITGSACRRNTCCHHCQQGCLCIADVDSHTQLLKTDRQTDRQTDRHTFTCTVDTHTHTHTHTRTYYLSEDGAAATACKHESHVSPIGYTGAQQAIGVRHIHLEGGCRYAGGSS